MSQEYDPASLRPLHEAFVDVWRTNNLDALGAFYNTVAVLLPPGRAAVTGRENIVAYWTDMRRLQDLAFKPTTAISVGVIGFREAGDLIITRRGAGRDTYRIKAKYIAIWAEADGSWKIDCMAWSGLGNSKESRGRQMPDGVNGGGSRHDQGSIRLGRNARSQRFSPDGHGEVLR